MVLSCSPCRISDRVEDASGGSGRGVVDAPQLVQRVGRDGERVAKLLAHARIVKIDSWRHLGKDAARFRILEIRAAKGAEIVNEVLAYGQNERPFVDKFPMRRQENELIGSQAGLDRELESDRAAHGEADQRGVRGALPRFDPGGAGGVEPVGGANATQLARRRGKPGKEDAARGHAGLGERMRQRTHIARGAEKAVDQEGARRARRELK